MGFDKFLTVFGLDVGGFDTTRFSLRSVAFFMTLNFLGLRFITHMRFGDLSTDCNAALRVSPMHSGNLRFRTGKIF